jgi:hypothetical protein
MEIWQHILVAIGGTTVLLTMIGWLVKSIIVHFLSKDVESFKESLRRESSEHDIRFSKLHEKRAEVIAELYELLVTLHLLAGKYVLVKNSQEVLKEYEICSTRFYAHFNKHRIYLDPNLCNQIDQFHSGVMSIVVTHNIAAETSGRENTAFKFSYDALKTSIVPLRTALEDEFRKILGVSTARPPTTENIDNPK